MFGLQLWFLFTDFELQKLVDPLREILSEYQVPRLVDSDENIVEDLEMIPELLERNKTTDL